MTGSPSLRPGMMTDSEINAELKTATGERLAALQAEREERRVYRAAGGGLAAELGAAAIAVVGVAPGGRP
jgi:hypothetical protein